MVLQVLAARAGSYVPNHADFGPLAGDASPIESLEPIPTDDGLQCDGDISGNVGGGLSGDGFSRLGDQSSIRKDASGDGEAFSPHFIGRKDAWPSPNACSSASEVENLRWNSLVAAEKKLEETGGSPTNVSPGVDEIKGSLYEAYDWGL
jgi:hypothetical protein